MKKLVITTLAAAALFTGSVAKADPSTGVAVIGGMILGHVISESGTYRPYYSGYNDYATAGYYSNVYGRWYPWDRQFPRFRCRGDAVKCSYELGVWERERQAYNEARIRAYECGRYGRRCEQEEE